MTADEDRQRQLTRDALAALTDTDFALAGAGAIREHGLTSRPTQDVDLFTASTDDQRFASALDRLAASLTHAGYSIDVLRSTPTFARLLVTTHDGAGIEVDLGVDWRSADPVRTELGPVLALADAVGSKIDALYSRGETRDYLDVDAIRQAGRFDDDELLEIVATRDPGFERTTFAGQLSLVRQLTSSEVARYGVTTEHLAAVQRRLTTWAENLRDAAAADPGATP